MECSKLEHSERQLLKDGLQQLQKIAERHGGLCLSDHYTGANERYRFQCARGHQWETQGSTVMRGGWCGPCAHQEKSQRRRLADGLTRLRDAAAAKGGECLAEHYVGSNMKYRFRCARGHEWESTGNRILRGAWCFVCTHLDRRHGIERMRELAAARGGRCLSEEYENAASKLQWQCHLGHTWWAPPTNVIQGHWCATCGHMNRIRSPDSKAWHKYRKAGHLSLED